MRATHKSRGQIVREVPTLILGILGTDASIDFIPTPPPKPIPPNYQSDRTPIPPGSEIEGVRQVSVTYAGNPNAAAVTKTVTGKVVKPRR